jgi:hypothetical protein
MPGSIPGPVGFAAFAAVQFGGYVLAGIALKRAQPLVTASQYKIAAVRTGLGVVIGPLLTIGLLAFAEHLFPDPRANPVDQFFYPFLIVVRFFVWMLVIFLFTKHLSLKGSKLALYSLCGAVWSCLLDLPGIALAFVSPGKIPFC